MCHRLYSEFRFELSYQISVKNILREKIYRSKDSPVDIKAFIMLKRNYEDLLLVRHTTASEAEKNYEDLLKDGHTTVSEVNHYIQQSVECLWQYDQQPHFFASGYLKKPNPEELFYSSEDLVDLLEELLLTKQDRYERNCKHSLL